MIFCRFVNNERKNKMATQKKTKTAKAKTQTKVKDLKPAKDANGGSFSWGLKL